MHRIDAEELGGAEAARRVRLAVLDVVGRDEHARYRKLGRLQTCNPKRVGARGDDCETVGGDEVDQLARAR